MKEKDLRLSNVRAFSCIAIVVLHTFFATSVSFEYGSNSYIICIVIRNLMLWAVPCFMMVTGALLLDPLKTVNYKKVFGKYIPRMLTALVIFSVIFKLIDIILGLDPLETAVTDTIKEILTGKGQWAHMWYLYTMTALYLIIPLLRPFAEHASKREIIAVMIIMILFLSLIPFITGLAGFDSGFYIPIYTIYPLFLLLGFFLHHKYFDYQSIIIITIVGYLVGITAFTLKYINNDDELLKGLVSNYSFPLTIIGSIGMFMILRRLRISKIFINLIDENSFGIYLIHMIPLKLIMNYIHPEKYGLLFVIIIAVGVFISSLIITALLKKIPGISKIL